MPQDRAWDAVRVLLTTGRNAMSMAEYRESELERQRTADLLRLMPAAGRQALDIGARDGHFSRLMADRFERVVALDLARPDIPDPRVECVQGDATALAFADGSFDLVFCAEVLEHIPEPSLSRACAELQRVAGAWILIGVPFRQDIRLGRTTCRSCGRPNPPWGHVNAFDEARLQRLFPSCVVESLSWVGQSRARTSGLATRLMDYAGNPYGSYEQDEPCVHCGQALGGPAARDLPQRLATRLAHWSNRLSTALTPPHGNWLHMLLRKR
ncbi:MAG: class I SAM-dependent methyltransferase [Burkholderiaceae bacterium]